MDFLEEFLLHERPLSRWLKSYAFTNSSPVHFKWSGDKWIFSCLGWFNFAFQGQKYVIGMFVVYKIISQSFQISNKSTVN